MFPLPMFVTKETEQKYREAYDKFLHNRRQMMPTEETKGPTITLPLSQVLDCLWGYKDRATLSTKSHREILEQLRPLSTGSVLFHYQELEDGIVVIWRRKEWEIEYQKYLADKAASERRVEEWETKKSMKLYIKELILNKLGEIAGAAIAETLSEDIVRNKNEAAALMFGADRTRLKWD